MEAEMRFARLYGGFLGANCTPCFVFWPFRAMFMAPHFEPRIYSPKVLRVPKIANTSVGAYAP